MNKNRYHLYMCDQERRVHQRPDSAVARAAQDEKTAKRVTSQALLESANELIIQHDGREYRLRVTQNGKLILTA